MENEKSYEIIECEPASEDLIASAMAYIRAESCKERQESKNEGISSFTNFRRLRWNDTCENLFNCGWDVSPCIPVAQTIVP